MCKLAAL